MKLTTNKVAFFINGPHHQFKVTFMLNVNSVRVTQYDYQRNQESDISVYDMDNTAATAWFAEQFVKRYINERGIT